MTATSTSPHNLATTYRQREPDAVLIGFTLRDTLQGSTCCGGCG